MAGLEAARVLLVKAAQDEYVLAQFIGDTQAADETFGFHAQQAAEKLLKAALAASGVAFPRTHRLGDLLDLSREHGLPLPEEFEALHGLTPFAVEYRYESVANRTKAVSGQRVSKFPARMGRARRRKNVSAICGKPFRSFWKPNGRKFSVSIQKRKQRNCCWHETPGIARSSSRSKPETTENQSTTKDQSPRKHQRKEPP